MAHNRNANQIDLPDPVSKSMDGCYVVQGDGNLVVYANPICLQHAGSGSFRLELQNDGISWSTS